MTIRTRQLLREDLHLMRGAIALFDEVFEDEPVQPSSDSWLGDLLANPAFAAIVALDDANEDRVVGAVTMYLMADYRTGRYNGYVYDVGVAESHRRQGIASVLMRELATHAETLDLGVLWVQAYVEDPWAIAFYEALGLEADEVRHFEYAPAELSKKR